MGGHKVVKEMRRCRKLFPWLKVFYCKYSEKFLDNDKLEALNYLMMNIDFEVKNIMLQDNTEKAPEFFKVLKSLFLHFCWQIRWKSFKTWKKYWKKADVCEGSVTSIQKECCVKLLLSLIQMAIFLTKSCSDSHWVDCVLTTIKLLPDSLNISCDALLLLNNLKKKHMLIYCVILKHLLFDKVSETITVPTTYIKVILLFRRLLKFTKHEKEKNHIKILASKLKPPPDFISWLLSLNIDTVATVKVENLTQDFLSRPFPDEFLRKLSEVLRKDEQLYKNENQVFKTEENKEQHHTFSETNLADEDSLADPLKSTIQITTKMLPQINYSILDKNDKIIFEETVGLEEFNKSKNEERLLDNSSFFQVKVPGKETKNKKKNVKKSKKEQNTVSNTDDITAVTKSHKKKKKKSKKDSKCYPKHTATNDKNQSDIFLSNDILSDEICNETEKKVRSFFEKKANEISEEKPAPQANERTNECDDALDRKVNTSESVRKHKKKKKLKSKKHKKQKRNKKCEKDQRAANSDSKDCELQIVNPNYESLNENSNEKEIYEQGNHSITKKFKSDEKMLTNCANSMCTKSNFPSSENQTYICDSKIINNNINLATENCLENSLSDNVKQTGNILKETVLEQNNYVQESKEKSKTQRKKLFNVEEYYYDKNQSKLRNPAVLETVQDSTSILLNKDTQHKDYFQVSKTIKHDEFISGINNSTSKRSDCEKGFTNFTVTGFEKSVMPKNSYNISTCDDIIKASSSKDCKENLKSSEVSISELLNIAPIKIYGHNKVPNFASEPCSKSKHSNHFFNLSQSEDVPNISDTENTLKINKRRKYNSQSFNLKPFSQSVSKNTENRLLHTSKKILKQTHAYEHCSSPSLFDEEIISNPSEHSENNINSQDERTSNSIDSACEMRSNKQNVEMHSNHASVDVHCDENSGSLSIQESNMLALVTESSKAQSLESDYEIQHLKQDFRTNSHYIVSDIQCDRNSLNSNNQESTISRVNEVNEIHSEHSINQYKENNETNLNDIFINEQLNKNLSDLTAQESNTLIVSTESNEIHSAVSEPYKTDVGNVFPNLSDDNNKHLSITDFTHCYVNSNDYIETKTNNSHLQNIILPLPVTKDFQNYQLPSPLQQSQSLLTRVSNNYINSDLSNENLDCHSPSVVNRNSNEIQSYNFENSHEFLNCNNRNRGNISDISTHCEKKAFLQNSKNTLNSRFTNNSGISFTNPKQTFSNSTIEMIDDSISVEEPALIERERNQNVSNYKSSKIEKNIPNTFSENESSELCNNPSAYIIDCKIINNHDTSYVSTFQNISSVQVILNLSNGNNQSLEDKNKIIANFDFQSESFISSPSNTNCLPPIPINDNSSNKNMNNHELPFMENLNSNKNSLQNIYLTHENNEISIIDSHKNSLNSFYNGNGNNSHIENISSTSNYHFDNMMERKSKDIAIQTEIETLKDVSLNDINLNNSIPYETSINQEINIINAKSIDHQNVQNYIKDEQHPSKKVKPLNSINLTTLNNQSHSSPSIINSNPSSSHRTTEVYSDVSEGDISVSTITNISEDQYVNSELESENSETENKCHNFVKTSQEIIKLPPFETFKQNLVNKSSPKKRSIIDDINYINSSKKIACVECSSNSDISNSKCKKNVTKFKRKPVKKGPLCLESKSHQYCLRPRKSLQTPEKFANFIYKNYNNISR